MGTPALTSGCGKLTIPYVSVYFMLVCTYSEDHDNSERSPATSNVLDDSQQPALQDDNVYSIVDNEEQEMSVISGNPACDTVPENSKQIDLQVNPSYHNVHRSPKKSPLMPLNPKCNAAVDAGSSATKDNSTSSTTNGLVSFLD